MANAARKICTKIGHRCRQLLTGAPKTSARPAGLQAVSDATGQLRFRNEKLCGQLHSAVSPSAARWTSGGAAATKPDGRFESESDDCRDGSSDAEGLPTAEQLENVFNRLGDCLPTLFKTNLDFSVFHPKLVFENNIRGTKTVGVEHFITTISLLRLMGHLKYAYVKFDVLKMTKHPEDGTIKIRWRITGISGIKVFMQFWKFRLFNLEQVIKENVEFWHDGFSVVHLRSDGLVHKLTADKVQANNNPALENKNPLATKLALFLGLSPQLNMDYLMSFESEKANELFKMVIISLEEVVL